MTKPELRKIARTQRINYHKTVDQLDIDAGLLHQWSLLSKDIDLSSKVIAGYRPTGSEINITALLDYLSVSGYPISYPLDGKIGFDQEPDIILAPLLAFDEQGNRLGHGQGYYDQALTTLAKTKKIIVIGVAYECQKLDNIPVCDMDYTMDFILMPSTFIRVQK
jgi:5-formyltetrahydrofolate cyclo-ligase